MRNLILLIAGLTFALPASAQDADLERIELFPEEKTGWSPRNIGAGISTIVTGPSYWYAEKETRIETVPAEANLALYYIRSNFQKRFERAVAPVVVVAPSRIDATNRDVVAVRAAVDGYLSKEVKFRVFDAPKELLIRLDPLPNSLVFLGHTHIAGRSTITLRTSEEPEMSVSRARGSNSFTLALAKTANKLEQVPESGSGHLEALTVDQLGEDLVVRVVTRLDDAEVRSKSSYDPIRKEHVFVLDVMRKGSRPPSSGQVRRQLEQVSFALGSRCHAQYGAALRERLDDQMLARAFRPSGGLAGFYQTEAMKRLGRLNTGKVDTLAGESYRIGSPIELALAMQSAPTVRDYLALLGALAETQPDPAEFLRALLAPEMAPGDFAKIYQQASSVCG